MRKVRARQRQLLRVIQEYRRDRGYPPSVRELSQIVGLHSTDSVQRHLVNLQTAGLIRKDPRVARSIVLTPDGRDYLADFF